MPERLKAYIHAHWQDTIRPACESRDSLIGLPYPYTTPCAGGMFQELYYWDTYFTNIGLLRSGMTDQAKYNIDNMLYLVRTYGKMPNGNRTYYLNRSQPPFLSQMVRDLFAITGDTAWLAESAYPALQTEYAFWMTHRADASGLNRYGCDLTNDADYEEIATYFSDRISQPLPVQSQTRIQWGKSMMALCESGWDCTSRFAFRAHEYLPTDLNSLLYQFEENMAHFASVLEKPDEEATWRDRAAKRRERMNTLLWNAETGVFDDVHAPTAAHNRFVSAAAFYPLFTGLATQEQAENAVKALPLLEHPHGVACCEANDKLLDLQWDYPHGWACLHHIAIHGLLRYGFDIDATRLAEKYVATALRNFEKTGLLWEKYNVVTGEVSTSLEYDTPPMMGWSAAVFLDCCQILQI